MAVRLFFSYSHLDESHRERLNVHLATLKRQGSIVEWHDRKIVPGQDWAALIDENLASADIILLLVSANFIASDCCYGNELQMALNREERGEAVIIPIILSPVDWKGTPFGRLQAIPKDARPITKWANREEAWMNTAKGIRAAVEAFELKLTRCANRPLATTVKTVSKPELSPPASNSDLLTLATTLLDKPKPLAASAMSTLYRGVHRQHGDVLLKVLTATTSDSEQWVNSPSFRIALGDRLVEAGRSESGLRYLLLHYIEGVCLGEIVKPDNTIRGALLDDLVMQVLHQLAALNLAHNKAVHRDVTPNNLILAFKGDKSVVHLIDYESGCFAGTQQAAVRAFGFSSREQNEGKAVPASDLYSLLSTTYFLATGRIPSVNRSAKDSFPEDALGVFTELEELYGTDKLLQCWEEEPMDRPASAAYFLANRKIPSTRYVSEPERVGEFVCSTDVTLELFDRRYSVRKGKKSSQQTSGLGDGKSGRSGTEVD